VLQRVLLRGYNTLSGNNQPLFIVDGIIIDNQTLNSNRKVVVVLFGLMEITGITTIQIVLQILILMKLTVTVLKGPEATALWQPGKFWSNRNTTRKAKRYKRQST
jgi:hypothetical protein